MASLLIGSSPIRAQPAHQPDGGSEHAPEAWSQPGEGGGHGRHGPDLEQRKRKKPDKGGFGGDKGMGKGYPGDHETAGIPPESQQEALDFLKQWDPHKYRKIQSIQQENPMAFGEVLRGVFREMKKIEHLKKTEPEQYEMIVEEKKLQADVEELADRYKEKEGDEGLAAQLRTSLGKLFDANLRNHRARFEKMKQELDKMEAKIEKRRTSRDQLVQQRFEEVTGTREVWDW